MYSQASNVSIEIVSRAFVCTNISIHVVYYYNQINVFRTHELFYRDTHE